METKLWTWFHSCCLTFEGTVPYITLLTCGQLLGTWFGLTFQQSLNCVTGVRCVLFLPGVNNWIRADALIWTITLKRINKEIPWPKLLSWGLCCSQAQDLQHYSSFRVSPWKVSGVTEDRPAACWAAWVSWDLQCSVPCCLSESAAPGHSFFSIYLLCCLLDPSLLALAGTVQVIFSLSKEFKYEEMHL